MYDSFLVLINRLFGEQRPIALHEPVFIGHEKEYINQCIDSTYVSSVGSYVTTAEDMLASQFNMKHAILVSSGTAALHLSLMAAGVKENDEVITQPLTFVATCNAIKYCHAHPTFIDVHESTLGLCPYQLEHFLENNTDMQNGQLINKNTSRIIKAVMPMHTFGHACHIDLIKNICHKYKLALIEDCAEGLSSTYQNKPLGSFGLINAVSFNGNKIVTAGGGGVVLTNDDVLFKRVKHLSTTAKKNHQWHFEHDEVGYNYRMPNINAALLCAQLENLPAILTNKRQLADHYAAFFKNEKWATFIKEPQNAKSNYWLNTLLLESLEQRDDFLAWTNSKGIMTRPTWALMPDLPMFTNAHCEEINVARYFSKHLVNIPSSARLT